MSSGNSRRTKKLINDPDAVIDELIAGMVLAHPDMLCVQGDTGRAVVAVDGPREGKVGIVIGGGSGHEPAFALYVGRGLADAAAVGNVFASPSPEQIRDAALAADGGAGILFTYGNYTGDVMNFTMAAESLQAVGIDVRQVQVTDDVASAPKQRTDERRGIAGDFFVFKIAGAAADRGESLDRVVQLTQKANAHTRSMGVALEPCSLPQTRQVNFEIPDDMMEIGMGLHGEAGIEQAPLATADSVTDTLMTPMIDELGLTRGDRVAVLVNGLGATSLLELYILNRRVAALLADLAVDIHHTWVGEYATSLEMAGASITLFKLDAELQALLDHACQTPALSVGNTGPSASATATATQSRRGVDTTPAPGRQPVDRDTLTAGGAVSPRVFRQMLQRIAAEIDENCQWLCALDRAIGDGDHGITMQTGWHAVCAALPAHDDDATIATLCQDSADAFLAAVGASAGPLYASALIAAGTATADRLDLDAASLARWIDAAADGIRSRGGAKAGDKTMLDAWLAAATAAQQCADGGGNELQVLSAACEAAEQAMQATADLPARRGRAAKLAERSVGHIDPGAASSWVTLRAMLSELRTHMRE